MEKTKRFVEETVKSLVTNPDGVLLDVQKDDAGILITIKVDQNDTGIVIGRSGETIKSLRVLARNMGAKERARISLKVHDYRDKTSQPQGEYTPSPTKSRYPWDDNPLA